MAQIATTIEQSKKLIKLGINVNTADMTYNAIVVSGEDKMLINGWKLKVGLDSEIKDNDFSYRNGYTIPAWSLSALLDILPFPQLSKDKLGGGKVGWMVSVYPNDCRYDSCWHDNPIDACYEMIIKLRN